MEKQIEVLLHRIHNENGIFFVDVLDGERECLGLNEALKAGLVRDAGDAWICLVAFELTEAGRARIGLPPQLAADVSIRDWLASVLHRLFGH